MGAPDISAELSALRQSDEAAFKKLVDQHRPALLSHCYRMMGTLTDAEDAVQDSLLKAWKARDDFEGKSQLRTWLYQIATRTCLDLLDKRKVRRHPMELTGPAGPNARIAPSPEIEWVEPLPEGWLNNGALDTWGPDARLNKRESIALALIVALQSMPGSQRAVFLTRDVLGLSAAETAQLLEMTVPAVNSALHRGREALEKSKLKHLDGKPTGEEERGLLERYLQAWESSDVTLLLGVLKDDASMAMPPMEQWFQGRDAIINFLSAAVFSRRADPYRYRAIPIRASGQVGIALYMRQKMGESWKANAIHLLEADGPLVERVTCWIDAHLFRVFGLPMEIG
jgi:RNA polymerase sigma-70 factor (ECF subfamily)